MVSKDPFALNWALYVFRCVFMLSSEPFFPQRFPLNHLSSFWGTLYHCPDVALLDLRMAEMGGMDVIKVIQAQVPTAQIIGLTTYDHDEDIYWSLQAGAKAYPLTDTSREELLTCIRNVHAGQTHVPSAIAAKLANRRNGSALTARKRSSSPSNAALCD